MNPIKLFLRGMILGLGFASMLAIAAVTLSSDITENGVNQGDLVRYLQNVRDVVNELQTDHATLKTAVDLLNHRSKNYVSSVSPVLAIDTNFDVKNTEVTIFVAEGVVYSLTDNTNCDTGTTKTIASSLWAAMIVEATNATTLTCTWTSDTYSSEALALAAAKAITPTASKTTLGFVTVRAHASGFTAGTDALTTGTGGNAATTTNYYSLASSLFPSAPDTLTNSTALTLSGG